MEGVAMGKFPSLRVGGGIIDDVLDIEIGSERNGILGSAIIKGRATEVIDVGYYLPIAFKDWFDRKDQEGKTHTRTVLFLDDSPFFRNMFTPVLQSAGYKVTTVSNGHEALNMLNTKKFDAIISDLEMPEMDGYAFVTAIRANPKLAKLPVVCLSSHTAPDAIERGRRVGFDDFVAKFDREGLIASLSECMSDVGAAA
jgi:two-component system chemotaxis sensor kinase CheA